MTLTQVWGALLIFVLCPLLGGLPLTGWWVQLTTGKRLKDIGTGNVGVSAAFYHGGTVVGLGAVALEAFKGIGAVLLAQHYFPTDPIWPVVALMALVWGRYTLSRGAGVTNVSWGFMAYDPLVGGLGWLLSLIAFTVLRERRQGRTFALVLLPVLTGLIHGSGSRMVAVGCLMGLIGWIYQKLPDDLDLPAQPTRLESRPLFRFFRGDVALASLGQVLKPEAVGNKAATLSQLRTWGYPVPMGYVLKAGDDPAALLGLCDPTPEQPVVVRSSAVGEDGLGASAAGQYLSVTDVTSREELNSAIAACFDAYGRPSARRYREDQGLAEAAMNVLVQEQIQGVVAGVAFSRDPVVRCGDGVIVEALPGAASQVVSGQITPHRYRVEISPADLTDDWQLSEALELPLTRLDQEPGEISPRLIQQVAYVARHLERRFGDIPQDIEWAYDGQRLWVLQSRPITTLMPLWTRKIAAEVIPGVIHPLTWSINQPLTCGVWGQLFTLVLGQRATGLDFGQTAMLHRSQAYFNATLLGDIFLRMGLPPESLEFLTRGAKFSRPPLLATLGNIPGLLRLAQREWTVVSAFDKDDRNQLQPGLTRLKDPHTLKTADLHQQIHTILGLLEVATWYNILAPLSFALRRAIWGVDALDYSVSPEIAAVDALKTLAQRHQHLVATAGADTTGAALVDQLLAHSSDLSNDFEQFLADYGYLSEVATDIAVPTWREEPAPVKALLATFLQEPPAAAAPSKISGWQQRQVQTRLALKGRVAEVYNRLLAELRTCFLALEARWLDQGLLARPGDIFFLTWPEIQTWATTAQALSLDAQVGPSIGERRQQRQLDQAWNAPYLVYGHAPLVAPPPPVTVHQTGHLLTGIGASPGTLEGKVQVVNRLDPHLTVDRSTILVVPYTDAGWAPLLAAIGGLIAEVGGQLSHGAIVAREYGIPAVMDVTDVTQRLRTGQRVRIDGQQGTVEIL